MSVYKTAAPFLTWERIKTIRRSVIPVRRRIVPPRRAVIPIWNGGIRLILRIRRKRLVTASIIPGKLIFKVIRAVS